MIPKNIPEIIHQAPVYTPRPIHRKNRKLKLLIPKIIHIIWIGPDPYPYEKYRATWLKHNPEWDLMFWSNHNLPHIHNRDVFDMMPHPAFQADVLRIEVLYKYGGVYSDADSYCVRPLDDMLYGVNSFADRSSKWVEKSRAIENGTMGCRKGDPFFGELVYGMKDHIAELRRNDSGEGYEPWDVAGRNYLYSVLKNNKKFTRMTRINIGTRGKYIRHKNALSWNGGKWNGKATVRKIFLNPHCDVTTA